MEDCNCSSSDYKCNGEKHSSNCIIYQGDTIELLGVCKGEPITKTMETIISLLQNYAEGEGIILSDITGNCPFVTQTLANQNKNLSNLIQILFNNQCTLRELIQQLEDDVNNPFSFDLKCLTTPPNPNKDQITQALIDLTCTINTKVNNIIEQLENDDSDAEILNAVNNLIGNFIGSNILACPTSSIKKTGTGSSTQLQLLGFVPIGGVIEYNGSIGNFDQTGKGLASACMENWALCNGQNGTQNKLGFVTAMATQNIPGGTPLPQAVISGDIDTQTQVGNRKGTPKVTLTSPNQIPDHTHNLNDPGHSHTGEMIIHQDSPDFGNGGAGLDTWFGVINTSTSTTGITIGGVKNRTATQPIENRQPTVYSLFIQRIS